MVSDNNMAVDMVEPLIQAGVDLVISPTALPTAVRVRLAGAGVALVERAGTEEVVEVGKLLGVLAWRLGDQVFNWTYCSK